jgi:hypothetical protein
MNKVYKNLEERILAYHLTFCMGVLVLFSLYYFVAGFALEERFGNPWWFNMLFGWSGLVVGLKLGNLIEDNEFAERLKNTYNNLINKNK